MTHKIPRDLLEKNLITPDQFEKINAITSAKIVSVFYELRTLLYLGVMLLCTGAGKNLTGFLCLLFSQY